MTEKQSNLVTRTITGVLFVADMITIGIEMNLQSRNFREDTGYDLLNTFLVDIHRLLLSLLEILSNAERVGHDAASGFRKGLGGR